MGGMTRINSKDSLINHLPGSSSIPLRGPGKDSSRGYPLLPLLPVRRRNRDVYPDAVLAVAKDRSLIRPDCVEY